MAIHHVVKERNFDSVFEPAKGSRSAKLTIKLKVDLFALDPSLADSPAAGQHPVHLVNNLAHAKRGLVKDSDDDPIMCRSWLTHEWNEFKNEVQEHGRDVVEQPDDPAPRRAQTGRRITRQRLSADAGQSARAGAYRMRT